MRNIFKMTEQWFHIKSTVTTESPPSPTPSVYVQNWCRHCGKSPCRCKEIRILKLDKSVDDAWEKNR